MRPFEWGVLSGAQVIKTLGLLPAFRFGGRAETERRDYLTTTSAAST
jgi:hypothetical protein